MSKNCAHWGTLRKVQRCNFFFNTYRNTVYEARMQFYCVQGQKLKVYRPLNRLGPWRQKYCSLRNFGQQLKLTTSYYD